MNIEIGKFTIALILAITVVANVNGQTKVGDKKDGGIVYWVDAKGEHGLIADVKDLGKFKWADAIVACKNKGINWYLPTKDELNKLYQNRDIVEDLQTTGYWTSSDGSPNTQAWVQGLGKGNGTQTTMYKGMTFQVRAVRAF